MRKFLSKTLIIAILSSNLCAFADTSNNNFNLALPKEAIPTGAPDPDPSPDPSDNDGLSSGAVAGIVAGSIVGGLALLGGLAWFYFGKGYKGGAASEQTLSAICLDSNAVQKFKVKGGENDYLVKALEISGVRGCPNSRYVLVPDSYVQNKTFNSVLFDVPQDMPNVRVTQVSGPFTGKEFEGKIFTGRNENTEVRLHHTILSRENEGIVQKEGKIKPKGKSPAALVISYDNPKDTIEATGPMRYAFVIEFYR